MYDNLPPGTSSSDRDAPWNEVDFDGADVAHGIAAVTGDNPGSMLETFSEFIADCGENEQALVGGGSTWLRDTPSDADLIKILLSSENKSVVFAATTELRARYLLNPYTLRVIAIHADDWMAEQREIMAEGAL